MYYYEYTYIARNDLSFNQIEEINNKANEVINSFGGKIIKTDLLGVKNLAYKIKKNKKAHYCLFQIEAPSEAITELKRIHSVEDSIFRTLALRIENPVDLPNNESAEKNKKNIKGVSELDNVDYKNVELLQNYLSERGKILPRRLTMATKFQQVQLSKAVKRARFLALLSPLNN